MTYRSPGMGGVGDGVRGRSARREVALVVLAGLVSLALLAASVAGVADPAPEVREQAAREARLAASSIAAGWTTTAARDAPPPGAVGAAIRASADWTPVDAPEPDPDRDAKAPAGRIAAAIAAVARSEGLGGDPVAAIALAREAMDADPEGTWRHAMHLDVAGWWGALGERSHRAEHLALAAQAPVHARRDGVSVALLAALERGRFPEAARGLAAGDLALPAPRGDRLVRGTDGLTLRPDALWGGVAARLAAGGVDGGLIDGAMAREPRRRAAAARLLEATLGGAPPGASWEVRSGPAGPVAVRSAPDGPPEIVALDVPVLHRALAAAALAGTDLRATFGPADELAAATPLHGPVPVPGLGASVALDHVDLEGAIAPLTRRARLTRVGFAALGLMTLVAGLAGARSLRRERRLNELRTTFVASVSHDLRTPTQAILLLAEALDDERSLPAEERSRYQGRIRREAERLKRLVEDLLDGARIDRGEGPRIQAQEVSSEAFIGGFEADAGAHAEREGASFSLRRGDLPATLWLDPESARRALWNLVENALRHGQRPGLPAEIHVDAEMVDGHLEVTVGDRGPGVAPGLREQAFDAFERLTQRGAAGEDIAADTGSGLGLAIVRAIARAHGGEARFIDPPSGRGAAVRVTFPQPAEPRHTERRGAARP